MPEETTTITPPADGRVYTGVWVGPKAELSDGENLPEEGEIVLLLLDDYSFAFGYFINGEWGFALPRGSPPVAARRKCSTGRSSL